MLAVIVASHITLRAMITVLHRDADHRGEGRVDHRVRGLMCEATMTKKTRILPGAFSYSVMFTFFMTNASGCSLLMAVFLSNDPCWFK